MNLVTADLTQAIYATREDWLTAAVEELRPVFDSISKPIPAKVRVACGFPLNAKRSRAIGECHPVANSGDNAVEIFISPELDKPLEVFEVLVHELCHATAGAMNHGVVFQKVAALMHLEPTNPAKKTNAWGSTRGTAGFKQAFGLIIDSLAVYPHAKLDFSTRKKQSTRLLKAYCPSCGYTIRLTAKWAAQGLPTCPCGDDFTL